MKKKRVAQALAVAVSFAVCITFLFVLLSYVRPMQDITYDFSMNWEEEAMPADWSYDQKGWRVFIQEDGEAAELSPDGCGGFSGLGYAGQTFYFSRVMSEDVDNPILRLRAVNSNLAVFLDGRLLYTDCPELDPQIGRLTLPAPGMDRTEPVVISLPLGYVGKTLTIAQSTNTGGSEKQGESNVVYPCAVTLDSGYVYESGLVAESFQIAIPAVLFFLVGVFLTAIYVRSVFCEKGDIGLACAAAASFLWLSTLIAQASFAKEYFGTLPVDVIQLSRLVSLTALLVFLSSRMGGGRRFVGWALMGIHIAAALAIKGLGGVVRDYFEFRRGVDLLEIIILLAVLFLGFWEWRGGGEFFRLFCPLAAAGILSYGLVLAGAALAGRPFAAEVCKQFALGAASYFLHPLTLVMMVSALAAAVIQVVRGINNRRTENRLLAQRQELAQSGYEAMRTHQEQVLMLRHDMTKHFSLLRQMTGEAQVADYLDELIAQNEKIRPVVQSGNKMLDIILNGKLTAAADAGTEIILTRTQAPETLPLSDAELCSIIVNIMDNAVEAASAPGVEQPYIKLDLHVKNDFFVFSCKNAATKEWICRAERAKTAQEHGLGLKIIRQIARRYGDLLDIEYGSDYYKVILVLPLGHSSK